MQCSCDCVESTMTSACAGPDTATVNLSTIVMSALAYYAWKRGLEETEEDDAAPESMYS